jgi:hypothetical protein
VRIGERPATAPGWGSLPGWFRSAPVEQADTVLGRRAALTVVGVPGGHLGAIAATRAGVVGLVALAVLAIALHVVGPGPGVAVTGVMGLDDERSVDQMASRRRASTVASQVR